METERDKAIKGQRAPRQRLTTKGMRQLRDSGDRERERHRKRDSKSD